MTYPVAVIVCGGRDHAMTGDEQALLVSILVHLERVCGPAPLGVNAIEIWHGGATGVDTKAGEVAARHGFHVEIFKPAQGELVFLSPTTARNEEMASRAEKRGGGYCIAFRGGKGTEDMVNRAAKHGLRIIDLRGRR